ncbi:MAG: thiamine pyrophosphate-dependent enzyme [bacterium]
MMNTDNSKPVEFSDYYNPNIYTWCTNCGNYGIHAALKRALVAENISPGNTMMFFDIGCNGNGSDKILGYRMHGLHGRAIPVAVGAHLANRKLQTIAFGGDGASLNEGVNHLVHAIRSDYNILFILHNNENFALTKGQASSATETGRVCDACPDGPVESSINIMSFILAMNPSFAARSFSGDIHQMTDVIRAGIRHQGFSVVEIMQNCPTYNRYSGHEWYQKRVYDVTKLADYDKTDLKAAQNIAQDLKEKIATGVLYEKPRGDFYSKLVNRKDYKTELVEEVKAGEIGKLMEAFR